MPKANKKRITIEGLALMTARGFEDVEQRLSERMDKGFLAIANQMAEGFRSVNARLDLIRQDTSDLPALRERIEDLTARVERLEAKERVRRN